MSCSFNNGEIQLITPDRVDINFGGVNRLEIPFINPNGVDLILSPQTMYDHTGYECPQYINTQKCDWIIKDIVEIKFKNNNQNLIDKLVEIDFSSTSIKRNNSVCAIEDKSTKVKHNIHIVYDKNNTTDYYKFKDFKNLKVINLSDNNISDNPKYDNYENIYNLDLIYNNNVEEVYLHNTTEIYDDRGKYPKINTITTLVNKSTSQPLQILEMTNLKILNISRNEIEFLPDNIKLVNLETLDLSHNKITNFPDFSNCINLKKLLLNDNQIKKKLLLNGNQINLDEADFKTNIKNLLSNLKDDSIIELNLSNNLIGQDNTVNFPGTNNTDKEYINLIISKCSKFDLSNNYFKGNVNCELANHFGYENTKQLEDTGNNNGDSIEEITLKTFPEKCQISDDIVNQFLYRPEINYTTYDKVIFDSKYTNKRLDMPISNLDTSKKNNYWIFIHIFNLVVSIIIIFFLNKIN